MTPPTKTLEELAESITTEYRGLPNLGREIGITTFVLPLPSAIPDKLPPDTKRYDNPSETLSPTYCGKRGKTLVMLDGRPLFGELAVVSCVERDGWQAVWVDSFHSSTKKKTVLEGYASLE